jgi:ankyrin repeat protein
MKKQLLIFMVMILANPVLVFPQLSSDQEQIFSSYLYGTMEVENKQKAVKDLIGNSPDVVKSSIGGTPILVWALDQMSMTGEIGQKAEKIALMLVSKGADVNGKNANGEAYLLQYALFGKARQIGFLIKHGTDVNVKDADTERNALHWVALLEEIELEERLIKQNIEAARLLIEAKVPVNAKDANGSVALKLTAQLGNKQMTEFLISKGADVNAIDQSGFSILANVKERLNNGANAKEKKVLPEIIEILQRNNAKDIRP